MSDNNSHAENENDQDGSQEPDRPNNEREETGRTDIDPAIEFGRSGTRIVERFQVGQITFQEGMVQLALEIARAQITPEEIQGVAQFYYGELAQIQGALVKNNQTGPNN